MIGIVETDTEELANAANTRPNAISLYLWKRCKIDGLQPGDPMWRYRLTGNVFDMTRKVPNLALGIQSGRTLVAGLTDTHQFHGNLSLLDWCSDDVGWLQAI